MSNAPGHPLQPLYFDEHKVARFRENRIVRFLLDAGPFDLNDIAVMEFGQEDRQQFYQLIGYSVGGYADLGEVSDESYAQALAAIRALKEGGEGAATG